MEALSERYTEAGTVVETSADEGREAAQGLCSPVAGAPTP